MIKIKNIDKYIDMLNQDGRKFVTEEKRTTITVYDESGKVKAVIDKPNSVSSIQKNNAIKKGSLLSIFATVKKSFLKRLTDNPVLEAVPKTHPSTFTNKTLWRSLNKNRIFYYVDINHCYWRIAYLQGYISEYYYNKILENPEYKLFRNMSLASVKASKTRRYYENGELKLTLTEDNRMLELAYANIRHTAWNIMGEIREEITDKECLKYMTDGIMVFKKNLNLTCNYISDHDLTFTVLKCKKISDSQIEMIDTESGEIEIANF